MTPIPERAPIGDEFQGCVFAYQQQHFLTLLSSDHFAALGDAAERLYCGQMIVRYGVRYLGKPHLSLVPALVALDYGEMLTGEAAWEFILKRSNRHPRADVVGYRNDGADEMLQIKWLDLALPVEVLVYADAAATRPIAQPVALIISDAELASFHPSTQDHDLSAPFAPRLLTSLPRYDSIMAWQSSVMDT